MGIQGILNEETLKLLPLIYKKIQNAKEEFDRIQMRNMVLREMSNCSKPIAYMNRVEKINFEENLLNVFKDRGWIDYELE